MNERIADNGYLKHRDEIGYFNDLILDLKKQLLGRDMSAPITMERLEEGNKHVQKLFQCRERGLWR